MNRPEKETFFHLAFLEMSFGRKEVVRRFDTDGYVRALNDYIDQLENAFVKACNELVKMCRQTKCENCHFALEQQNELNDCPVREIRCISDWKEWCMRDEEAS